MVGGRQRQRTTMLVEASGVVRVVVVVDDRRGEERREEKLMGLPCPSGPLALIYPRAPEYNGPQLRARLMQSGGGVGLHCRCIASNARSIRSTKAAPLGSSQRETMVRCGGNSNCATMGAFRSQSRSGSHGASSATHWGGATLGENFEARVRGRNGEADDTRLSTKSRTRVD
ncbi:hypothetical protein L226DRAFT_84396 [Lentinus tigrinus ALCF2SS1-7]|uniref:uncharacterized protein n=1 Tax=Lentinus tigrinus ALCF2SS1-7 TaxID=1328758 RepID=UPI001166198A|nr:hypothetical protein L226DRAFT_84396 [Lentinus tigrinus ALCF2SS1-7]